MRAGNASSVLFRRRFLNVRNGGDSWCGCLRSRWVGGLEQSSRQARAAVGMRGLGVSLRRDAHCYCGRCDPGMPFSSYGRVLREAKAGFCKSRDDIGIIRSQAAGAYGISLGNLGRKMVTRPGGELECGKWRQLAATFVRGDHWANEAVVCDLVPGLGTTNHWLHFAIWRMRALHLSSGGSRICTCSNVGWYSTASKVQYLTNI